MSHTINNHVVTGTNLGITKAIHVLLIHCFAVLRISNPEPSQNLTSSSVTCTVANVISWRQNEVIICPGSGILKTFAGNVPFHTITGTGKNNFSKHFLKRLWVTKCFYTIIGTKHDFRYINICLASREVLKICLSGAGFNTSLRAQQMLMHRKSCLILIIKDFSNFHPPPIKLKTLSR